MSGILDGLRIVEVVHAEGEGRAVVVQIGEFISVRREREITDLRRLFMKPPSITGAAVDEHRRQE